MLLPDVAACSKRLFQEQSMVKKAVATIPCSINFDYTLSESVPCVSQKRLEVS